MKPSTKQLVFLLLTTGLWGCATDYRRQPMDLAPLPTAWQHPAEAYRDQIRWRSLLSAPELEKLLRHALKHNIQLSQQERNLAIARENLTQNNMALWPELSAGFGGSRSGSSGTLVNNKFELNAQAGWEVNLWGQLSDAKKASAFAYSAELARYQSLRQQVVREVATAWLNVVEAQQLLSLFQHRLDIQQQNLNTIENGYRSGLNTALEVYLTSNDVQGGLASYAQQRQILDDARRSLALSMGDYPHLDFPLYVEFPDTGVVLPPQLPALVLTQRPDLQAAWLQVLQQNSLLAVAHKARFPAIRLTASSGYSSSELDALVDGNNPLWSVAGSLLQPLVAGGRLRAGENIARLRLEQLERQYRDTVYRAFAEIESTLQNQQSLAEQLLHSEQSAENAKLAETLSFDQYLRGLVTYTTFLEAQRRAIDADIQLIRLRKQMVANRVVLHQALAGDLDFEEAATPPEPEANIRAISVPLTVQ